MSLKPSLAEENEPRSRRFCTKFSFNGVLIGREPTHQPSSAASSIGEHTESLITATRTLLNDSCVFPYVASLPSSRLPPFYLSLSLSLSRNNRETCDFLIKTSIQHLPTISLFLSRSTFSSNSLLQFESRLRLVSSIPFVLVLLGRRYWEAC